MIHENLKNKVIVITGGGGVLCSAFAKDLAAQGAKIAVLDLREEAAQLVVDEIKAAGGIRTREDMEKLNVTNVSLFARATDHMPEIINQIQR